MVLNSQNISKYILLFYPAKREKFVSDSAQLQLLTSGIFPGRKQINVSLRGVSGKTLTELFISFQVFKSDTKLFNPPSISSSAAIHFNALFCSFHTACM